MTAHTEALRKCEVCNGTGETKSDGYLDCTNCDAADKRLALNAYTQSLGTLSLSDQLWAVFQYAQRQAEAERVLREGEKQEPVYWSVTYCGSHTGNVKGNLKEAQRLVERLDRDYKDEAGLRAAVPLYTHPASSPTTVPKLPGTPEEVVAFIGPHFDSLFNTGPIMDWRFKLAVHDLLSAFRDHVDFPTEVVAPTAVVAVPQPWWADTLLLKHAELYRVLRKMPVILDPYSYKQVSGALLDHVLCDHILKHHSKDGKLPWEGIPAAQPATAPSDDVERETVLREAAEIAWQYRAASNLTQEEMRVVAGIKNAILAAITATKE